MTKKKLFLILLILGTAFWGISFSVVKLVVGNFSASTFLFYRFLIATLVLSVIFFNRFKVTDWPSIKIGMGLSLPLMFGIWLQTLGIKYTAASQCAFVAGMCVVIVPVLKIVMYKTFAPLKIWVAALIALTGLFVISVRQNLSIGIGDIYVLTGAVGFAVYLIKVEQYSKSRNLVATIVPMFATCTLITGCFALTDAHANWMPDSDIFWIGVAYCALFSTAYMYTISNLSQRYLSAEKVALIYLFEPIFGAIAAFFVLSEVLTWQLFAGGLMIFIATLISEINIYQFARKKNTINIP